MEELTVTQTDYINKCTITYLANKYIVQTPMGFHAGSYKTEQEAKDKIMIMAKCRE